MTTIEELMHAALGAPEDLKLAALRVLRGERANPEPTVEPYMTLKQVAAKLNLHPSTLWRWDVPKHDLGGRPRFLLSEIRAYLESAEFKRKADGFRADRKDRRKEQLLALANDGNEEAAADLFKEFGVEVQVGAKGGAS